VWARALARRLVEKGTDPPIRVIPGFMELKIAGEDKTGIRLIIEK
jgi:stage V sporulation protein SpoVS